ncbi:hypothetical protein Tco_0147250, partial [Tanacetum coccineum]
MEKSEIANMARPFFGGKDSGEEGGGLSMVELGLWDKNGVEKPVTCLGGKIGGKSCFEFNRNGFGVMAKLAPHCYKEFNMKGPCGDITFKKWQD